MATPRETALKNLEKAHKSPRIGKRGPSWRTIAKEKAREFYMQKLADNWDEITSVHIKAAKNIKNKEDRKEAIHQMIGKPVETLNVSQEIKLKIDV